MMFVFFYVKTPYSYDNTYDNRGVRDRPSILSPHDE
jgi:hypothetical protein